MRLFYRIYGNGTPIVALHGLYASSDTWMGLINELSCSYQLILVDLRNHGRSPHSPEHSYASMSDDLLCLLDELSIKQAIFMGHSMGGKAAMYFSLRHPERVKGLVVEDISPLEYPQNHEITTYHQEIMIVLKSLPINSYTTRKEAINSLSQTMLDRTLSRFLLKNLQRNKNGKLEWRINLDILSENLLEIMKSVVDGVSEPLKIPCLFIKGSESKYISAEDEGVILKIFPNAAILAIQNANHWVHNEQQKRFLQSVKHYLSLLNSAV